MLAGTIFFKKIILYINIDTHHPLMLFMKTSPWCINQISFLVAMIMIVSIKIKLKMGVWYVNLLIYYGKFLSRKKIIRARDRCAAVCLPFLRHNSKSFMTPQLKYREKLQYHNSHQSVSFVTSHVANYLKLVPWCDI